jgi:hypothetical protein
MYALKKAGGVISFGFFLYICRRNLQRIVMVIERTDNEIIVRIPSYVGVEEVQRILDLVKLNEITAKSQATQEEIDEIAREAKKGWWEANRARFIHA